jgi:hypothetical protein
VIHRWGWTLVVNPDGTTTAWNKDKTKTLHSHGPPARAGVTPPGAVPLRPVTSVMPMSGSVALRRARMGS